MNVIRYSVGIGLLVCLSLTGCSGKNDTRQKLLGRWSGDMSDSAIADRIAQLKRDYPNETRPMFMDIAKNMGLISLDIRDDGTVTAVHEKKTFQGNWKFDAVRSNVEFDLVQTVPAPTASGDGGAAQAMREPWIATFDPKNGTLELFMNDREVLEYYQRVAPGKKSGIFVLKKK